MAIYKAIRHGLVTAAALNARFRELYARVEELESRAGIVDTEPVNVAQPAIARDLTKDTGVALKSAQDSDIDGNKGEAAPFDWRTSNDVGALRSFAKQELGLTIASGVKKPGTARTHIEEFLQLQAGD